MTSRSSMKSQGSASTKKSCTNAACSSCSSKNPQSGSVQGGNSSVARAQSYNSQASNSAAQAQSYDSQASNSASQAKSYDSQASNSAARAQSYNSQASNSAARAQSYNSQASNSASQAQSYDSQASNSASQAKSYDSQASNSASRAQSYNSQASNSASRASNSASRGPSSASQASNSASQGQSSASWGQSSASQASNGPVKYGELSVLGHSSTKSFTLYKRPKANGVKPSTVHKGSDKSTTTMCGQSSMTFVTPVTTVIVEYAEDRNTDMFQIGRSTGDEIDYVFDDFDGTTVSRFACRIICQRSPPYTAHIYAAGFDSEKNIFLGPDAVKWESHGQMDGLTTNGVLVMQPLPGFTPGPWREISVCGSVLTPRESPKTKGKRVGSEQELVDGTLIDLCGVTLLWRTTERPIKNLAAMLKNFPRY